ncbi:MAG: AraC family transcriptional regulator [Campylobacteraceae bacterium]|jgi:AraC-like DNA-binding protein|nr:AraC family transcriptional regulator [Campylobacteraceae bacterium]
MDTGRMGSLAFHYAEVFFTYLFNNDIRCTKMVKEHTLVYVYSGELVVQEGHKKTFVGKDECVFIKRNNRVSMTKQPKGEERFKAIFMLFSRSFLREFYRSVKEFPHDAGKLKSNVVKLPLAPDITSLFVSMTPYFNSSVKPLDELMRLKQQEGAYALLNADERFYSVLFDFTEPWKIDILDFLNKNYTNELTLDEIAHFTGRSLATLKRDFKKISDLPPQKWIIERRLQAAHDKIYRENRKVSDVYIDVGFKNLSHFSYAFKKRFGKSPTKID